MDKMLHEIHSPESPSAGNLLIHPSTNPCELQERLDVAPRPVRMQDQNTEPLRRRVPPRDDGEEDEEEGQKSWRGEKFAADFSRIHFRSSSDELFTSVTSPSLSR